jgi:hypothetical protein
MRRGIKRDKDIMAMFGAVLINQVIDLPHYLWSGRHSEWVLFIESIILVGAAIKIIINARKK